MQVRMGLIYRWLKRCAWLVAGLLLGIGGPIAAVAASEAPAVAGQALGSQLTPARIFTFLFLMLGPIKIVDPFGKITQGADPALVRRIALLATLYAALGLLLAAFLGEGFLVKYGIPLPVLVLAAGTILFLVALLRILGQSLSAAPPVAPTAESAPTLKLALAPLAFPTIVTPHGIAALIVFLALSPDQQGRLRIGAMVLAIMVLNLMVMLLARRALPLLGIVLGILGAVLGVIQVALGLQIINVSLRALGVL
jgi:multiple antibiotic resistance protein